jgi:hypothetical protein
MDVKTVSPDENAGVLLAGEPVRFKQTRATASSVWLPGSTAAGKHMELTITLRAHLVDMEANIAEPGVELRFQSGGASPAYGLADHAVYLTKYAHAGGQFLPKMGRRRSSKAVGQSNPTTCSTHIVRPLSTGYRSGQEVAGLWHQWLERRFLRLWRL